MYPQGDGCPDHPGPLKHFTERESCWACDILWVYEGSDPWEQWFAHLADGDQFRLPLEVAA